MPVTTTRPEQNLRDLESQIARLNRIGIALSSEHNLQRLLNLIVSEARRFTRADGGSLYIKEEDKLNFVVAQTESLEAGSNGKKNAFRSFYVPLTKESISGYVATTGEVLNIEDAYMIPPTVEYRLNKDFDYRTGYRTKSMLVVPMKDHEDEIIGVLQLINSLDDDGKVVPFRKEYETLVHSLASQAAVAIRNVKLIEEIRTLFRSLVRYSAKAIDARSPHTAGHSGRVAEYSVHLMYALNEEKEGRFADLEFTAAEIEEMRMAGWLHDIGKIGVREAVLEKENKLNNEQMQVIEGRFRTVQMLEIIRAERRKNEMMQTGAPDQQKFEEVDQQLQLRLKQLQDDLAFLKKVNTPGFLPEEDRERLKKIAESTYDDLDGERYFMLTADEYENLSVVKGNLTEAEYKEIQSHVVQTLDILENIPFTKDLENIPKYAAAHHEMLDGSGYPYNLKGDQIPLQGRIMAVCDIFDALTASDRPYKKAMPLEKSLAILRDEAERGRLDKDLVDVFIRREVYKKSVSVEM